MSFFSSLFGKKDSQTTDADTAPANTPAPIPEHILNPPIVERKPFEVPASEAGTTAQSSVAPVVSDAQNVAESLGGAISAQTASEVLASSESNEPEVLAQMDTDLMTSEDIIAAYKIFLRRRPENMDGVTPRVGLTGDRILFDYLMSDEFTGRPEVAQLVFNCAKKILDAKKVSEDAAKAQEQSQENLPEQADTSSAPSQPTQAT